MVSYPLGKPSGDSLPVNSVYSLISGKDRMAVEILS